MTAPTRNAARRRRDDPGMDDPNIVVLMTDQHRADVSAREGFGLDTTPFLDSLAARGSRLLRAYTPMPVCMPARISLLTGRYPSAHRVRENYGPELAVYERDLFDVAKARGYATAMVGKNHSHLRPERLDHWFELFHEGGGGDRTDAEAAFDGWLAALHHEVSVRPTPFPVEVQLPHRIVSDAERWIGSLGGRPFCLWLSFPEPHNPYQVPEPYFSLFPPESLPPVDVGEEALAAKSFKWRYLRQLGEAAHPNYAETLPRARSNYYGMLRLLDDEVRRFVEGLEARGLLENTLILYVSDHGDYVGEYGLVRKGAELPEVLTRTPMFVVGPGVRRGHVEGEAHVSLVDALPTLCEALGVELPPGAQGRSLWPLLSGGEYPREEFGSAYAELGVGGLHYTPEDVEGVMPGLSRRDGRLSFDELNACTQSGTLRMVRKGDWKLVLDMHGKGQLYHLPSDPREAHDLYDRPECLAERAELLAELAAWMMRADDPLPIPERGYKRKTDARNYWSPYR
jgi:arylsulfatase A-like enzyme